MLPTIRSSKELNKTFAQDLPKYFVRQEMDAILEGVKNNRRDHLFLTMLWQTGARVSEMLMVKVRDINVTTQSIELCTLKRKKRPRRVLPVKPETIGMIATYVVENKLDLNEPLFAFSRARAFQIVRAVVLAAGFDEERAHPHTFRHSFAVNCLLQKQPTPVTVLKEWMGHSNISTTLVYTKIIGRDSREYFDRIEF